VLLPIVRCLWCDWCQVVVISAEFKALSQVFPEAMLRLCIFHVARNVTAEVRRCTDVATAKQVHAAVETMSRLGRSKEDRQNFVKLVRLLHKTVLVGKSVPDAQLNNANSKLDSTYQIQHVIAELESALFDALHCQRWRLLR